MKKVCTRPSAFTLAEVLTVIVILGAIAVIIGIRAANINKQRLFETKYHKIYSQITANIEKDMMQRTGFQYSDYNKDDDNRELFRNAVLADIPYTSGSISDWSTTKTISSIDKTIDNNWLFYNLDNGAVLAFDNASTTIVIDVNGSKKPNKLDKDIYVFNSLNNNIRHSSNASNGIWFSLGNLSEGSSGGGSEGSSGGGSESGSGGGSEGGSDSNSDNGSDGGNGSNGGSDGNNPNNNDSNGGDNNSNNGGGDNSGDNSTGNNPKNGGCTLASTMSDTTYTYTLNSLTCSYTKTGCVNSLRTLNSNGACVCKDPTTKTDSTYTYTLNSSTCSYTKTGCANSGYTLSSGSCLKTCTSTQITTYLTAHYRCAGKTCARSGDDRRKSACKAARQTCLSNCPGNANECNNNSHVIINDNNSSSRTCDY